MHETLRRRRRGLLTGGILATWLMTAQFAAAQQAVDPSPTEVVKELEALKKRIAELDATLKNQPTPTTTEAAAPKTAVSDVAAGTKTTQAAEAKPAETPAVVAAPVPSSKRIPLPLLLDSLSAQKKQEIRPAVNNEVAEASPIPTPTPTPTPDPQAPAPAPTAASAAAPAVDLDTPFAYADFTWMQAVPRTHDAVLDGKYFSGEFRIDSNYIYDFNHPIDHTLVGTTEGERTGEIGLQAINVGGDFHAGNMQGRLFTQFGAVSTAVPRNDASYNVGQWQTDNALRYMTEAYAGYHLNVNHGLNFQAGVFLSFIGLFSYYSFDNWAYQPSYVSSNTPWFFTGFRIQWFPTNKLKFEPWFINGWQSYNKYNGRHGVGGQILWRPTQNLDFVFNTYALGRDAIGNPNRSRYHLDWSQEVKWYENPKAKGITRMAFTLTEDIGCETGGGVVCHKGNAATPAQNFVGAMGYQRFWFGEKFAATIGGGVVNNPGRYLVLLPPINGMSATSAAINSPYFTENPGDKFKAYDFQTTFDYMPSQWVTWRVEFTQRGTNIPYFSGPGGITPQTTPGLYVNTGDPTSVVPGFTPDLRKRENRILFSLLVKL